jgi:hypothetical protein
LDIGSNADDVLRTAKSARAIAYRTVFRRTIVDAAASAAIGMSST